MNRSEKVFLFFALFVVCLLGASIGYGSALITVQTAQAQPQQNQKVAMVKELFSRRTDLSIQVLQSAAQTIQAELDRLGSDMNAQQVMLDHLQKAMKLEIHKQQKEQLLSAGYSESDPVVSANQALIDTLETELGLGE